MSGEGVSGAEVASAISGTPEAESRAVEPETKLLASIFRRATRLVAPKMQKISEIDDTELPIGLISHPIRWRKYPGEVINAEVFARKPYLQGLRLKGETLAVARENFLDNIAAAAVTAKIVCFGEGAFPLEHAPDALEDRVAHGADLTDAERKLLADIELRNADFSAKVQQLATDKKVLVIAGTSHDRNCNNIARVYSPGWPVVYQPRKISASATMGEKLQPREKFEILLFNAGDFNIVVLICIDAFVPTTVIRCALLTVFGDEVNYERNPVRYIFVPSLNDRGSEFIEGACRDLSMLCDCVVTYLNCHWEPRFGMFAGGSPVDSHEIPGIEQIETEKISVKGDDAKGVLFKLSRKTVDQLLEHNPVRDSKVLRHAVSGDLTAGRE